MTADNQRCEVDEGSIGWAVEQLKRGRKVIRRAWKPIYRRQSPALPLVLAPFYGVPRIAYTDPTDSNRRGDWWHPGDGDLLATDWQLASDKDRK